MPMDDTPSIYHLRPPRILGETLLPLNLLCATYPELSEKLISKYEGREAIPKRLVPELGCHWGDCVQFSTVHPEKIREAMIRTGHSWPDEGVRFLVIRSDHPTFTAGNTIIWLYSNIEPTDFTTPKADVVPFTPASVAELGDLKAGTQTYLQETKATGRRPLLFVGVPHVLHRGEIPLEVCNEIVV